MKNLGVYIDRYMLFDVHISEVNKKVMGLLMFIRRISDNFDKQTSIIVARTRAEFDYFFYMYMGLYKCNSSS